MQKYKCPPSWGMIDVQRFANQKGWKIIRAEFTRGLREKKMPKDADEMDAWFAKPRAIPSHWNILYIPA